MKEKNGLLYVWSVERGCMRKENPKKCQYEKKKTALFEYTIKNTYCTALEDRNRDHTKI